MEGGALLVSGGRVRAVGRACDLRQEWPEAEREDLGGCALVPGLVNAHTHLELTCLGEIPSGEGSDFVGWILDVVGRKRAAVPDAFCRGVREGALRCRELGQAVVADVLSVPTAGLCYPEAGPRVAAFPEVIAPHASQTGPALERALSVEVSGPARVAGLSPHAPYTVGREAYRACGSAVAELGRLLMTHLAESAQEIAFCRDGTGEIPERLYGALGQEAPAAPDDHPLDWLDRLGLLRGGTILIHAVHLRPEHVDLIALRGSGVVLCPRSNRRLGVGRAAGRRFLAAGVAVGLGTDSRLSAGNLNLWEDLIAAVDEYGWSPEEALRAATLGGATLLGAGDSGRFAPGARADILAVSLSAGRGLWDQLLPAAASGCRWVG
ncbi:MAG: amidohydrolase family protein [Deltaproteobacteria bacterium]|nr:amidohydrolase family protein [Deltaproteobacteria bacterium]